MWDRIADWHLVLPPSRPDVLELRRIRAVIDKLERGTSIGILGSTPEFRDLVAEMGFVNVFVFDKNLAKLRAILFFIGLKLVLNALRENDVPFINGGRHVNVPEIPPLLALAVIAVTLVITAVASLRATRVIDAPEN